MEDQNQAQGPVLAQEQEEDSFPQLTQEQIDRIVNRQLRRLEHEYQECQIAEDLNVKLAALKVQVKEEIVTKKEEAENDDEDEGPGEEYKAAEDDDDDANENPDQYEQMDSDEGEEEQNEKDSKSAEAKKCEFPKEPVYVKEVKPITTEKAKEMQNFIANIKIKPPQWASNISDDQFKNMINKVIKDNQ